MDDLRHLFGETFAADLPDAHRNCPPLDQVLQAGVQGFRPPFLLRCQSHKNRGDRVIGAIYGNHLAHRYGCRQFPPPHIDGEADEFTLICDKCGREWTAQVAPLIEALRDRRLSKIDVEKVSRREFFLGSP